MDGWDGRMDGWMEGGMKMQNIAPCQSLSAAPNGVATTSICSRQSKFVAQFGIHISVTIDIRSVKYGEENGEGSAAESEGGEQCDESGELELTGSPLSVRFLCGNPLRSSPYSAANRPPRCCCLSSSAAQGPMRLR